MGCQKVLFVDGVHLSGPYKGMLLRAIMLDVNDHLFDVAYVVIAKEGKEEWFQFLSVLAECLLELKPVIMSDHHDGLLYAIPRVSGVESPSYHLTHFR